MPDGTLDVLLIEDTPGDARLVEELLVERAMDLGRVDVDGTEFARPELHHESALAAGIELLSETPIDVILLDLELPDSTGLDTLVSVIDATECTPIVVLTDQDDRDLGVQTIQHGAHDYLVKHEMTAGLLVHSIQYAIEQSRQERERVRHREQLAAVNRLYTVSRDVIHTLITESTREEIERAVCERLVEPDAYDVAWIGEMTHPDGRLSSRVAVPADAGFDGVTVAFDAEPAVERPEAKAVRTREAQIVPDIQTAPAFEHCEQLHACGYRTMAAIPIAYGNVCYGVLTIYDESPGAVPDTEQENLSRLGEIIGHAITAVERKDALASDTMLQLVFSQEGVPEDLVTAAAHGWTIELDQLIRTADGMVAYGTVDGISKSELHDAVARSSFLTDLRILSAASDGYEIGLTTTWGDQLLPALANHGAVVTALTISDSELEFAVEVSSGGDKHQLVELVNDHYPDATLCSQGTVPRGDPSIADFHLAFENQLTPKQRAVLKTAFHAGYFEWPRTSTGGEVAERLGVTQATFSEHFRNAERTLFEAVFGASDGEDMMPDSPWEQSDADHDDQ